MFGMFFTCAKNVKRSKTAKPCFDLSNKDPDG